MSKSPKYPIAAADEPESDERRRIDSTPPWDLYLYPSFKFRHEVREPLENGETSYYRAYPHFLPRRVSTRRARRQAIRHGGWNAG
jgi:hypothetical protein